MLSPAPRKACHRLWKNQSWEQFRQRERTATSAKGVLPHCSAGFSHPVSWEASWISHNSCSAALAAICCARAKHIRSAILRSCQGFLCQHASLTDPVCFCEIKVAVMQGNTAARHSNCMLSDLLICGQALVYGWAALCLHIVMFADFHLQSKASKKIWSVKAAHRLDSHGKLVTSTGIVNLCCLVNYGHHIAHMTTARLKTLTSGLLQSRGRRSRGFLCLETPR